ncbi:17404_t:CDS:1 [Funneliformis caledonium]|uniref:17404_t:CDS:1 n=1 Tax=Funneliformis caledonium TaxID=1117310 RepID=A0A9N9AF54_9GLOM|nr:17404_t:CDS:1 [Funneliformis caledonium]
MVVPDSFISEDFDHQFFYQFDGENYSISCVLYSQSLIENVLNKEMFGIDIDINNVNNSRCNKLSLSLQQKFRLENNLKIILPSYLSKNHIPQNEMRSNSDGNMNDNCDENEDSSQDDNFFEEDLTYSDIISYQGDSVHNSVQNVNHHNHSQQLVDFNNNLQHQNFCQPYVSNIETRTEYNIHTNSFHLPMEQVISDINQNYDLSSNDPLL